MVCVGKSHEQFIEMGHNHFQSWGPNPFGSQMGYQGGLRKLEERLGRTLTVKELLIVIALVQVTSKSRHFVQNL